MDFKRMAEEIIEKVGGKNNISNSTHCATRLRLNLKDRTGIDEEEVKNIEGVTSVVDKAGQYQILIGTEVPKLYEEVENILGGETSSSETESPDEESGSLINNMFSAISGIFAPILPALAGSGILRGLILLAVQLGWLEEGSGTFTILNTASMAVFYFLPVLLAFTSARRFGASPYISVLIGAALLHPDFIGLMGDEGIGATTQFAGIPVVLYDYSSTVVPIILSIWGFSYLYKFLDKNIPENLKFVGIPLISLAVMIPLTVIVIGPLGAYGGQIVATGVNFLIESSSILAGIVVGGAWSLLVSLGIHWAVNPIMINNVSTFGFDYIVPFTFACNFAVMGTALGVFFKAKNEKIKNFSMTGVITIALSGIIEPTLFGLLVKNRKLFLSQIIGGAVGGAYLGLTGVFTNAFVFGSVTTFPAFIGENFTNLINASVGLLIALVVAGIISYMFTSRDEQLA